MTVLAIMAGAIISVLALGGVEPWAFAPAQVLIVLAAVVEFWKQGLPRVGWATRCLLALLLAVPLVQLLPLPSALITSVSPSLDQLRQTFVPALGPGAFASTFSISPHETKQAFLKLICYVLVFLLAFRAARHERGGELLLRTLIGIGLVEAAYGLVQYLTGWQYIYTFKKVLYTSDATGTYVNRNHFAGLLEMVLPFVVARVLIRTSRPWQSLRSLIVSPLTSRLLLDGVLLVLLGTALVFSRSRMGIAAGLGGILVACAIAFLQSRRRTALKIAVLVLAIPIGYSAWIGLEPVMERYEQLAQPELVETSRLLIWRDTRELIRDYPLLGTGLGTYAWSSVHYQSGLFDYRYEHAHNDYLEFAAEIGIPATVLLFGSLWFLVLRLASRASALERSREKLLAAGCAGALAAILTHGITDFNLQIPANAFLFAWIAGTAAALVSARSKDRVPQWRSIEAEEPF